LMDCSCLLDSLRSLCINLLILSTVKR
jgi:hypothetical protein